MPVPKRKRSKARRDKRFANKGIKPKAISGCLTCQSPIVPHTVCKECGYYKGNKILRTKTDRLYERGQVRQAKEAQLRGAQGAQKEAASADVKEA
jgi:large subunit ribosomal protein L32